MMFVFSQNAGNKCQARGVGGGGGGAGENPI